MEVIKPCLHAQLMVAISSSPTGDNGRWYSRQQLVLPPTEPQGPRFNPPQSPNKSPRPCCEPLAPHCLWRVVPVRCTPYTSIINSTHSQGLQCRINVHINAETAQPTPQRLELAMENELHAQLAPAIGRVLRYCPAFKSKWAANSPPPTFAEVSMDASRIDLSVTWPGAARRRSWDLGGERGRRAFCTSSRPTSPCLRRLCVRCASSLTWGAMLKSPYGTLEGGATAK